MKALNQTMVSEFILLGLTDDPQLQVLLFGVFLLVYIITLLGNIGICTLIRADASLHTPMYFFLLNLSSVDMGYSSVVTPKMLVNFLLKHKSISFSGCAAQLFWFIVFLSAETLLLSVMAYDRYVAICNPLLYSVIMNRRVCMYLISGTYAMSVLNSAALTASTFSLSFCSFNEVRHFACEMPALMKVSCTSTYTLEVAILVLGNCVGLTSCAIILTSYVYILTAILRIRSPEGRHKAFSTCGSHCTTVSMYYGTIFFMYFRPNSSFSVTQDKVVSVIYSIIIPMLNPMIYSLRNKEVKGAFRKLVHSK